MLRSNTDSHIAYSVGDEPEAPGSGAYITREGTLDLQMVMLAVYQVFRRDASVCSLRVLETGLNVCDVLIEMGVMYERLEAEVPPQVVVATGQEGKGGAKEPAAMAAPKLCEKAHALGMGIARRTLLHLGCPHGCNEGEVCEDEALHNR